MRIFVAFGAVGLAGIALLSLTAGYRMRRFTAWLHPEADLDGAGWQLTQGKVALGTGGWWGVGPRRQPGEVGRPARGAHRLHLPGHRRGARPVRRADRAGAVRRDHHLRPAHGHPDQRLVRADHLRGHRRVDRRPGPDQPGRRPAAAADHRCPAAVHLLRRVVAAALVDGHRRAAGLRPAGGRPRRGPDPATRRRPWRSEGARRAGRRRDRGAHRARPEPRRRPAPPRPRGGHHRPGHREGPRGAPGAGPRLRAADDPRGPPAAPAVGGPRHAARSGPRGAAPDRGDPGRRRAPTSSSASVGTSRCRPTSPPVGRGPRW